MKIEEKALLQDQIQTDVSLISFLSVISVFFLGSLLPEFSSYDLSVKIPISFLIVSTFAFVFSALILSNSGQLINEGNQRRVEKHVSYGYAISEYLGVFLFILSVPLTISVITSDYYLRFVTFCASILGMAVYEFGGFSLLNNHFKKRHRLFSVIILTLGIILFVSQTYSFYFTFIASVFLFFILLVTILAPIKEFQ